MRQSLKPRLTSSSLGLQYRHNQAAQPHVKALTSMPDLLGNLNPQKWGENKQQKPGIRLPWTSLKAQPSSILR